MHEKEIHKKATQSFRRLLLLMVAFTLSLSLFAQAHRPGLGIVLDEFGEPMID